MITNAHCSKTPGDGMTIGRVSVPDQVVWRFIPREGIGDLVGDPFGCGIARDAERYQPPAFVPQDDQTKSNLNPTVGTTKKSMAAMPAAWLRRKVFQVCDAPPPLLAMYLATVSDLDPELQQFAMDARSAPKRVG